MRKSNFKPKFGTVYTGWHLHPAYAKGSIFLITEAKRKTKPFLRKVCQALGLPDAPSVIDEISYWIQPGNLEVKALSNGREYFNIYGSNWSGYGDFIDKNIDTIIKM